MRWLDTAAAWLDGPAEGSPGAQGWLRRRALWLAAAGLAFLFALRLRDAGLYPSVLSDELRYGQYARLQPLPASPLPSWLFLWLYASTRACGDAFLDCARGLDAALLLLAGPPLYAVSRTVASPRASLLVTAQALLGPFSTYAAFFMPECLYFLGFWTLAWFLLKVAPASPWRRGAGAGALIGLLALVKAHGLFLLPGLAAFWAWGALTGVRRLRRGELGPLALATLAGLALTRLGVGWLLAGPASFRLLGSYAGLAGDMARSKAPGEVLGELGPLLAGHGLGLALLFALPLALLLVPRGVQGPASPPPPLRAVEGLLLAFLPPLVAVAVAFTVGVAGLGPYEVTSRLHLRYYDFAFPLFSILAAGHLSRARRDPGAGRGPRWALALLAVPLALGAWTGLEGFVTYLPDAPELYGLRRVPGALPALGALGLVTLGLAAASPRRGLAVQVLLLGPLLAAVASVGTTAQLRSRIEPMASDRAGQLARRALGPDTSALVVAGPERADLQRALFQVDDPAARLVELAPGQALEPGRAPAGARWVLYLGDPPPCRDPAAPGEARGFCLERLGP